VDYIKEKKKKTNKQTNKQTNKTKSYPMNMESVEKILGNLDAKRAC